MDVDFGVRNEAFETFSAFNGVGKTIEWMRRRTMASRPRRIRFLIDVDGRKAEALVVSKVGTSRTSRAAWSAIVDAAAEQANGVARGLGAMAQFFDCDSDRHRHRPGRARARRRFQRRQPVMRDSRGTGELR